MQRAIPPDSAHARLPHREGPYQHESIGDLYFAADNFAGAAEAYAAALREAPESAPAERLHLLLRLADAESQRGRSNEALAPLREARALTRRLDDPLERAAFAARLAVASNNLGRYRAACRYARYAYAVLRDTDDHATVAKVSVALGLGLSRLGHLDEAIEWLQGAAATFRRTRDDDGLVAALNNLGLIYKGRRQWREAVSHLEQALRIDERAGLYARMRGHHQNLGLVRHALGEWDLAEEHFRRSLQIARELGHRSGEALALLALGRLARRRRQFERAEEQLRQALALANEAKTAREQILAAEFIAELELDRGRPAAAQNLLERALTEAMAIAPQGDLVMEIESRLGLSILMQRRPDDAQSHLVRALSLAERLGDRLERSIAERSLARLEAMRANTAAFESRLTSAIATFEELGETYELATTLASWGELMLLLPSGTRTRMALEPAAEAARRGAALYRQLGVPSLAAEALMTIATLEAEREHYDQALALLEQAETWLHEHQDDAIEERVGALRRQLEQMYVAVSLSTSNEFRALDEANRLFRDTADMDGLLAQTVRLAVEHSGGDRGFVAFSSSGARLDVVAQHGLGRDRARRILQHLDQVVGARMTEQGPIFSSRVAADPRFSEALAGALEGVGSLVCVPLNFPSQSVGLLFVDRLSDSLQGSFKQRDLNLLAVLANTAAVAIVEAQRSRLLVENQQLRQQLKPTPGLERVISQSREMSEILRMLQKVSDSNATILFMGETGTGKGLLAQVVHDLSNRRELPFVQVNCAALPEHLLESELFGYVQGAFTGAVRDKSGLFEEAGDGTIFLDEIEKIPETVQAKLLHVLDRGEMRPLGATRSRRVEARVICATGVDLRDRIREGRFLEDLYYRLNDITVRVPAMRERREDIPLLAQHFLDTYARQMDRPIAGFAPEVLRVFLHAEWRGNVRELEKTVKRMVVLAEDGETLGTALLPPELRESAASSPSESLRDSRSLRISIAHLEKRMVAEALDRNRWNKAKTARELGLSYPTLLSKIRVFKLEKKRAVTNTA
ncbi:MAG: sigma 54-interacting transcriptional regulator [Candidatus Eisenbacteria bacterium]|uniref:Sigma 54-interacting transcriptional regulator n=1 Tax=Eiseniibacteriota bacterium TaxID=2212470 RepID=A0A849SD46_UNCEI|nr:sigma 54-interacting transcriptional regulator [Candidatus Eisenbacteria bacterium]